MPRAWECPAPLVLSAVSAGTVLCVSGARSLAFGFPAALASAASMRRPFRPPVDICVVVLGRTVGIDMEELALVGS